MEVGEPSPFCPSRWRKNRRHHPERASLTRLSAPSDIFWLGVGEKGGKESLLKMRVTGGGSETEEGKDGSNQKVKGK